MTKLLRGGTKFVAYAYPIALIVVVLLFRWVGEQWWATGVALYLPRWGFALPLPFIAVLIAASRMWRLLYTQAVALILVIFPLMGFVVPIPSFADEDAPTVKVLSYNVDSVSGGANNIVAQIDRFAPDLVFLQEVFNDKEEVTALLEKRYPFAGATQQFVFASRFPVVSSTEPERVEVDGKLRTARFMKYVIDTPLGRISFYNVHPNSPREGLASVRGKGVIREIVSGHVLSGDHSGTVQGGSALREAQLRAFVDMARKESDPVVIAGDTNLPVQSYFLHQYLSDYRDGFEQAGSGFGYTFPSYQRSWYSRAWMRIDRVLASDPLRFVKFAVGESKTSDHYCVYAELQRKSP